MRAHLLLPAGVFLGLGGLGFWLAQRKARRVKYLQQEELDVSQARPGTCKVLGVVQQPAEPLKAPLSGAACVFYRVLVQELIGYGRNQRWATIYQEARTTPFLLKDRKGPATVRVDLTGAEVNLDAEGGSGDFSQLNAFLTARGQTALLGRGELRANETTLSAGEKIFVLGAAVEPQPGALTLQRGEGPFIVSDQDSGQIGYQANNAMYLHRFWGGTSTAMGLYCLWHSF